MINISGAGQKPARIPLTTVDALVDAWVDMWNRLDLDEIDRLFDDDDDLTYFPSQKQSAMRSLSEVRGHHEYCGFIPGGKPASIRIWLEERTTTEMRTLAVVSALWFMKDQSGTIFRGPVTFVCKRIEQGWNFTHLNFGSYT